MSASARFLKVLDVELEDLEEDIGHLIEHCRELRTNGELPTFVYYENESLFRNELLAVDKCRAIVADTKPQDYESLDALVNEIKAKFVKEAHVRGFAKAAEVYINRKIDKVVQYLESCKCSEG